MAFFNEGRQSCSLNRVANKLIRTTIRQFGDMLGTCEQHLHRLVEPRCEFM